MVKFFISVAALTVLGGTAAFAHSTLEVTEAHVGSHPPMVYLTATL